MDMEEVESIREKLAEVQSSLLHVKRDLLKAEGKRHKTKSDFTRITRLTNQRDELQTRKDTLNASLPAMYNAPSMPSTHIPPPFYNPAFLSQPVYSAPQVVVTQRVQALPSGSNVTLGAHTHPVGASDDEHFNRLDVYGRNIVAGTVGKADE